MSALLAAILSPAFAQSVVVNGHGTEFSPGAVVVSGSIDDRARGVDYEVTVNGVNSTRVLATDTSSTWSVSVPTDDCSTGYDHGYFTNYFRDLPSVAKPFTVHLTEVGDEAVIDRDRAMLYDNHGDPALKPTSPNGIVDDAGSALSDGGLDQLEPLHESALRANKQAFNDAVAELVAANPATADSTLVNSDWQSVPANWEPAITGSSAYTAALITYLGCLASPVGCPGTCLNAPPVTGWSYKPVAARSTVTGASVDGDPNVLNLDWRNGDVLLSKVGLPEVSASANVLFTEVELKWCNVPMGALDETYIVTHDAIEKGLTCYDVTVESPRARSAALYTVGPNGNDNDVRASFAAQTLFDLDPINNVDGAGTCADASIDAEAEEAATALQNRVSEVLEDAWSASSSGNTYEGTLLSDLLHPFGVGMPKPTFHQLDAMVGDAETGSDWGQIGYSNLTSTLGADWSSTVVYDPSGFHASGPIVPADYHLAKSWTVGTLNQILRARTAEQLDDRVLTWDEIGLLPPAGSSGTDPAMSFPITDLVEQAGWWEGLLDHKASTLDGRIVLEPTLAPFVMTPADGTAVVTLNYFVPQMVLKLVHASSDDVLHAVYVDADFGPIDLEFGPKGSDWMVVVSDPPAFGWMMAESQICAFEDLSYDWAGSCAPQTLLVGPDPCEGSLNLNLRDQFEDVLEAEFLSLLDEIPAPQVFSDGDQQFLYAAPGATFQDVSPGRYSVYGDLTP